MKVMLSAIVATVPALAFAQSGPIVSSANNSMSLDASIGGKSATLAPASGDPRLRFIDRTTGEDKPLSGSLFFYGGPLIVEATFADKQEDATIAITLEWTSTEGAEHMRLVANRSATDPHIYRSDEFYIVPETTDDRPKP